MNNNILIEISTSERFLLFFRTRDKVKFFCCFFIDTHASVVMHECCCFFRFRIKFFVIPSSSLSFNVSYTRICRPSHDEENQLRILIFIGGLYKLTVGLQCPIIKDQTASSKTICEVYKQIKVFILELYKTI